jgi:uncharacterized protein (DUF1778 family)
VKSERLEARVSPDERALIERAAAMAGLSVSAFLVTAAVERADEIITDTTTTTVPAEYFDKLVAELDRTEPAPALRRAAVRARRHGRIATR